MNVSKQLRTNPASDLSEVIYTDAKEYFNGIIHAIDQAKKSIDLEVYIFDNDSLSQKLVDALKNAANRKVKVRLLTDGVGACIDFYKIAKNLQEASVEVKVYHPLPWHFEQWPLAITDNKGFNKFLHLFTYINKRDHRKLLIIDQNIAWLGSFNISKKHLPISEHGEGWRDTAIEIKGLDLEELQTAFDACWFKWARRHTSKRLNHSPFIFNLTRALRSKQRSRLINRIESAQNKVWITNAYFIPDKLLLDALTLASYRGVDVQIILPRTSDIFFIPWASSYFYSRLLTAGVKIFEFQSSVLHSKTLIIDDWASIGSSNLNRRSLHHDLELDYSLQLPESKDQLTKNFETDRSQSEKLDADTFEQTRGWQRFLGGILVFLLARWV